MTSVLLLQLDGKLPNIALMRISAHHRALGDEVEIRNARTEGAVERGLWDDHDRVYASTIFAATRPVAERLLAVRPDAVVGGTGWDLTRTLEDVGITTRAQDYSIYPDFTASIGFSQRGCRLRCPFCVVPAKEGAAREEQTIADLWRGEPWPRHILLLDNDFFGVPAWRARIEELRAGRFRVAFSQGINARMLDNETAAAIASVDYRDDGFRDRRIYTAWDSRKDEARLFAGLEALVRHGVRPQQIMVYMLVGYWPGEGAEDREYRRARLRAFGARPYPMPYRRTPELVGFQRWVIGAWDKTVPWPAWVAAGYCPRRAAKAYRMESHMTGTPPTGDEIGTTRINPKIWKKVAGAASKDSTRHNLGYLQVSDDGGSLRIDATDGHRAHSAWDRTTGGPAVPGYVLPSTCAKGAVCRLLEMPGETVYPDLSLVIPAGYGRLARIADLLGTLRVLSGFVRALPAERDPKDKRRPRYEPAVSLTFGSGWLGLWARIGAGEIGAQVPIDFEGAPLTVGCNPRYLLEALECCETAQIELAAPEIAKGKDVSVLSPFTVRDFGRFAATLMPMRL